MQAIIDAIYAKATAVQTPGTFYAAMGGRIYNEEAPQNPPATYPYAVFQTIYPGNEGFYGGINGKNFLIQWDVFADKTATSLSTLAGYFQLLFDLFDRAELISATIGRIKCTWNTDARRNSDDTVRWLSADMRALGTDF